MTTRRQLLQLASALGLAGTIPTTAERIAAAEILGQEVSSRVMLDPGKFAKEISLTMGNSDEIGNDWYGVICPEEHADNLRAEQRIHESFRRHGLDAFQECGDFESASLSFALAMYDAGIRQGAAFENLRRSMVGEFVQCMKCFGTGSNEDGGGCKTCGGNGTVAMKD